MSDSLNALTTMTGVNLPSTQLGADDLYTDLTQSAEFLGRLQLYTKGTAVNKRLIGPGEYGIPLSKDEILVLGDSIDILPLARRPKAIDMSDTEAIIVNYDPTSDEFKRIASKSGEKDSGCMYGISFLVIERSSGRFLEYFCGTKSTRPEAGKIFAFLPKTEEQCALLRAQAESEGRTLRDEEANPHGPRPLTLKSKLVEKGTYSWHVPVVMPCSTEFRNTPPLEKVVEQITKFLTENDNGTETVKEDDSKKSNRRR